MKYTGYIRMTLTAMAMAAGVCWAARVDGEGPALSRGLRAAQNQRVWCKSLWASAKTLVVVGFGVKRLGKLVHSGPTHGTLAPRLRA